MERRYSDITICSENSDSSSGSESESDDDDDDAVSIMPVTPPSRVSERKVVPKTPPKARIVLSLPTRKYQVPQKVIRPKVSIKEFKFKHIMHKLDEEPVFLPLVVFDTSNMNSIFYEPGLDLFSLKDIVAKGFKRNIPVQLAQSPSGSLLKELSGYSLTDSRMIFNANEVNSTHVNLTEYPLVYGAVPSKYMSAARYFISSGYKQLRENFKNNTTTNVDVTPFMDGQLELMVYSYWLLESQDLIRWRNDLKMTKLKYILKYLVSLLDEDYMICNEGGTPFKLKDRLSQFADFDELHHISDQCMLVIKINFEGVVNALKQKYGRTAEYYEILNTWKYFLQKCNVHHYICEHTLKEITGLCQKMETVLTGRLADVKALNYKYSTMLILRQHQVYELLKFHIPLNRMKDVTESLQHCVANFFTVFTKMLARHLIEYRIIVNSMRVSYETVIGFMTRYNRLVSQRPYVDALPTTPKAIHANMTKILAYELETLDQMKNLKIDIDAIKLLNAFINGCLLKALEPLIFGREEPKGTVAENIENAIHNYFNLPEFSGTNADLWHQNDDSSDSEDGESDSDDDDDARSSSSSDFETECDTDDENLADDLTGLELPMNEKRIPKAKKSAKDLSAVAQGSNMEALTTTLDGDREFVPQKKIINNKYFKNLVATSKIYIEKEPNKSRLKCAMCHNASTNKLFAIGDEIIVSCCMQCIGNLIEDTNRAKPVYDHAAIKTRILSNCRPPIAFNLNGSFREDGEMVSNCKVQYNKLKRQQNSTATENKAGAKKMRTN